VEEKEGGGKEIAQEGDGVTNRYPITTQRAGV